MDAQLTASAETLVPHVYEELTRLARNLLRHERRAHTLEPAALVNEAYLKLRGLGAGRVRDTRHFVAIAARAMRQVLINHAERRHAAKRGGDWGRVELDHVVDLFEAHGPGVAPIGDALDRLAEIDPTQAMIVELRFFGGLTVTETAQTLDIPQRTIEREWSLARAWLRRELDRSGDVESSDDEHVGSDQGGVLRSA